MDRIRKEILFNRGFLWLMFAYFTYTEGAVLASTLNFGFALWTFVSAMVFEEN